MRTAIAAMALGAALMAVSSDANAQMVTRPEADQAPAENDAWFESRGSYSGESYHQPTPLEIIQQKAQARALSRMRRIETMAAYGMSNSRPSAMPVPTGMYSPAWQMSGGRPYAWFTTRRPQYILWR